MSTVIPFRPRNDNTPPRPGQPGGGSVVQFGDRAVYTVKQVSYLLSLSIGNTYELVRDGTIPAERLGRRWVIPRARFHAWLDGLAIEPDNEPIPVPPSATRPPTGRR